MLARDPGALALTFLMPLMFIIVMSTALAGSFDPAKGDAVPLAVADYDQSAQSGRLLAKLRSLGSFRVEPLGGRASPPDRGVLDARVRAGRHTVVLLIPKGFGAALGAGSGSPRPAVEVLVDPATGLQFVEPLRLVVIGLVREIRAETEIPGRIAHLARRMGFPLSERQRTELAAHVRKDLRDASGSGVPVVRAFPRGVSLAQYPDTYQQNVPGYTIFGIFWIVTLLASSVLKEKEWGTLRRLQAAPLVRGAFLAGKLMPYLVVNLLQIALMLGAGRLLFGLGLGRSPGGLVAVSLATAVAATGLGVLVASLVRTEAQATGLTTLIVLSLAALGGCFVPRFLMPDWLRAAGLATPHAWALEAYQDLLVRGHGLLQVLPSVGILLLFGAVFFLLGVWRFRLSE